jgi:hypothetical protein
MRISRGRRHTIVTEPHPLLVSGLGRDGAAAVHPSETHTPKEDAKTAHASGSQPNSDTLDGELRALQEEARTRCRCIDRCWRADVDRGGDRAFQRDQIRDAF